MQIKIYNEKGKVKITKMESEGEKVICDKLLNGEMVSIDVNFAPSISVNKSVNKSENNDNMLSMTLSNQKVRESSLGFPYGSLHPMYEGVIMDALTFPDSTYFYVNNGCWWGCVQVEDAEKYIYTGVDMLTENAIENGAYVRKIALRNEPYDVVVSKVKVRLENRINENLPEWITYERCELTDFMDTIALLQIEEVSVNKNNTITSQDELENYIFEEYEKDSVELSSLFFDVNVRMKKKDILYAYLNIQKNINGDDVVRLVEPEIEKKNEDVTISGTIVDLIPDGEYEDVYEGNCRYFLESFNDKEIITGLCRIMDMEELDGDRVGGIKLDFIW